MARDDMAELPESMREFGWISSNTKKESQCNLTFRLCTLTKMWGSGPSAVRSGRARATEFLSHFPSAKALATVLWDYKTDYLVKHEALQRNRPSTNPRATIANSWSAIPSNSPIRA
jgi:hypothetical protein